MQESCSIKERAADRLTSCIEEHFENIPSWYPEEDDCPMALEFRQRIHHLTLCTIQECCQGCTMSVSNALAQWISLLWRRVAFAHEVASELTLAWTNQEGPITDRKSFLQHCVLGLADRSIPNTALLPYSWDLNMMLPSYLQAAAESDAESYVWEMFHAHCKHLVAMYMEPLCTMAAMTDAFFHVYVD